MEHEKIVIWLIGEVSPNIPVENGLPSARDMLKKYFFNHSISRKSKSDSIVDVAKEVSSIWKFYNTVAIDGKDVLKKIRKVVQKFENLKKSKNRRTSIQVNHEQLFIKFLDDTFDIAPKQRYHHTKPGPKPKILPIIPEENKNCDVNGDSDSEINCVVDSSNGTSDIDFEKTLSGYHKTKLSIAKTSSPTNFVQNVMKSPDVYSTLDRIQLSSPKFTMLCASMARANDINLNDCVLSTSTVARRRATHRETITTIVKDEFSSAIKSGLVVHWDGKKLKDRTNEDKHFRSMFVERIAVVVAGIDTEKIVTIAKAENGKGIAAADIVYNNLKEWNVLQWIIATCTDTTAANTGHTNGSVVLFENLMQKFLLYFACRHHVLELIVGAIFTMLFGDTTAPSRSIFENFKRDWYMVDQTKFEPLNMNVFKKNSYLSKLRTGVITYVENILSENDKKTVIRGDYKEMLQLCLIVLGKTIPNYTFNVPKCCSNARWMAHIIYSFKLFLFRRQVELSKTEIQNLQDICLFTSLIYTKAWIQCCSPSNAPHNDLEFIKELHRYGKVNKKISDTAIAKFQDHLWYLGSELIVLALFSDKVNVAEKRRIFDKMRKLSDGKWTKRNKKLENYSNITKKNLSDLVDSSSMTVLESLRLDIGFMFENNVREWHSLEEYKTAKKIVDSFKVVNDTAERALKLMTEVNSSLTNNEQEKQKAIQVIEDNRKRIPTTQKYVLSSYKLLQ